MTGRRTKTSEESLLLALEEMRLQVDRLKASGRRHTKAVEVLLKRDEILSKVFRLIPDIFVVTELESGLVLDVNDRYLDVMGYGRDDVIGNSTVVLNNWEHSEDRAAFVQELKQTGACSDFKTVFRTRNGRLVPAVLSARIIVVEGVQCVVSIARDVTELKQKEEALKYRLELERLVAGISTRFVTLRSGDIDKEIDRALEMIGDFTGADRCSVWQFMPDGARMDATNEWCASGIEPRVHKRKGIPAGRELPLLSHNVRAGKAFTVENTAIPDTAVPDHGFLRQMGIASLVAVPMAYAEQPIIVVCCEAVRSAKQWSADLGALLKIAGEIFINALVRGRKERELRDSEERFRTLFDNAQDGLLVADPQTMLFSTGNRSIARMLGYSQDELRSLGVNDIHPPEVLPEIALRFQQLASGVMTHAEVVPVRRKDGSVFYADITAAPVTLDNRQYVLGSFRDITGQLHAETERLRLFSAVEQATEFITILAADGSFQYMNPAGERLFGYPLDDVQGKSAFVTDKGVYDNAFYRNIWNEVSTGRVWAGRLTCRRKDGSLGEIEQSISPVRDKSGAIIGFLSIGRDITNEIRLEQALRQAQKMEAIGTLAGGVAHDFNNILSVITGYAQILLSRTPEDSPEETSIAEILKAGRRARDLVRQILTFSRQTEQEMQAIHIAPVIKETLRFLRASLPSTISLQQQIESDADIVVSDPTQIHQIIMNLCTNAAHAMKQSGGTLSVRLLPVELGPAEVTEVPELAPGSYLKLSVADTGHGIGRDVIDRIFDPYFTTKIKGEGTGLGLAVVHGIVKNHGGAIRVSSARDQGTTFDLWFPRCEADVSLQPDERKPIPLGTERILLVDDEAMVLKMERELLARLGYSVTAETGAPAALEIFRASAEDFDLVVTDKTMPVMTGFELARNILAIRPDLPVIMCTGFSDAEDPERARMLGIHEIVMKPLVLREIAEKIRQVLDTARHRH